MKALGFRGSMQHRRKQVVTVVVVLLVFQLDLNASLSAQQQTPLVSKSEMRTAIRSQSHHRTEDVMQITQSLSRTELIGHVSRLGGMKRVEAALGALDDATLRYLAEQCRLAEKDFSGGLKTGYWVLIGVVTFLTVFLLLMVFNDPS
ncbi:MAG: hypothetical protein ACR2L2_00950 [Acidobacteriota bacterium]